MAIESRGLVMLIGLLIGVGIYFLPSALAILRGNLYKGQVIKYQLIILIINVLVVGAVSIFAIFASSSPRSSEQNMMSQSAVDMTEEAVTSEPAASPTNSAPGVKIVTMICVIGSAIWALISIVLWFYILIHAFNDTQIFLLSRFGINI